MNEGRGGILQVLTIACVARLVSAHVAKGICTVLCGSSDLCEPKFLCEEMLEEELTEIKQANKESVGSECSQAMLIQNVIKLLPTRE